MKENNKFKKHSIHETQIISDRPIQKADKGHNL